MNGLPISRRAIVEAGSAAALLGMIPATAKAADSGGSENVPIRPFKIAVPESQLDDILYRIRHVHWPVAPQTLDSWQFGASLDAMKDLQNYWLNEYDWREQEVKLNVHPHFKANIEGYDIHYVHVKGSGKNPQPIILTHGWPGSYIEFLRAVDRLAHPEKYNVPEEFAFDVVIPSLPGFAYSSKPLQPMSQKLISRMLDRLMVEGLGYKSYIAQGGDFGAGISVGMAAESQHCKAANINLVLGVGSPPQNNEERAAQRQWDRVYNTEGAYQHIQRTKPLSLSYGFSDSPIASAAWLFEKYRTWSGVPGDNPWSIYPKSQFMNIVMTYITTNSLGTSTWLYTGANGGEDDILPARREAVKKPNVGVTHFPSELVFWPESYAERVYNLLSWTDMPAGGHFGAFEQPIIFAREMRDFSRLLKGRGI
jgi:pimeloyl-ACP methyl ester carboxylesterase